MSSYEEETDLHLIYLGVIVATGAILLGRNVVGQRPELRLAVGAVAALALVLFVTPLVLTRAHDKRGLEARLRYLRVNVLNALVLGGVAFAATAV
jgi:hypothetical protein